MRIPIVNEQDEVIEYIDRNDRDIKGIRRVIGLWVTAPNGDILLARRSLRKKHNPGIWGPAVSGTVEEGETYEDNIIKEMQEEIGLIDVKPILGPKLRRSSSHEYFAQWFTIVVPRDYPFKKQDEEVEEIRWFTKKEILKFLEEKPEMFSKNFKNNLNYFSPDANQS